MEKRDNSQEYYLELFETCEPINKENGALGHAYLVASGKPRYQWVEDKTGAPWYFTGLIHLMECGCLFTNQILNGQPINVTTTMQPKGLGPWKTWEDSAFDALKFFNLKGQSFWTPWKVLYELEKWNGWGYRKHGVHSPYLWSGSNHGVGVGKYVKDGKYDPKAVSKQIGAAVVLKEMVRNELVIL